VIYDSEKDVVLKHANFKTAPKDGVNVQRADYIADRLIRFCKGYTFDIMAIEEYAFSRPTNLSRLGEVVGIVKLRMWEAGYGVDWTPIIGTAAKKFATGSGKADKAMMVAAAQPWIDTTSDDVADALAVARLAADHAQAA